MSNIISSIRATVHMIPVIIGRTIVLALAVLAGLVLLGLVVGGTAGTHSAPAVQAPPASTPTTDTSGMAPHERPIGGATVDDGFSDHHLFNADATLDTSHIDDLRSDPEGQCLADGGVMTPERACVAGVLVWREEISPQQWHELTRQGYVCDVDDADSLWIPLGYVILGGESGEDVLDVDLSRPLTQPLAGR
jgi:hypothetical protein